MSYHALGSITDDIHSTIDEYAAYTVDAIIYNFKDRFKAEIPDIVDAAVPKVKAAAEEMAPQLLETMKPALQQTVTEMMQVALADATLQALIDTSKKQMMIGLALVCVATVGGVVGIQYLMKD